MSANSYNDNTSKDANLRLNEALNKGEVEVDDNNTKEKSKTEQANMKLNENFYSEDQANDSTPTSYLYNNIAAVDVTGNKDQNR